jgi:hypothetical protein
MNENLTSQIVEKNMIREKDFRESKKVINTNGGPGLNDTEQVIQDNIEHN